jgi:hypothetical protein
LTFAFMKLPLLALAPLLSLLAARAQTPTWQDTQVLEVARQQHAPVAPDPGRPDMRMDDTPDAPITTAIDEAGNVYLGGSVNGTQQLGRFTICSATEYTHTLFVAKWSVATCDIAWVQSVDMQMTNGSPLLAVHKGNVYVLSSFEGPVTGLGALLRDPGHGGMFLAKLTDEGDHGTFRWAQPIGSPAGGVGANVLLVQGENVYVAGRTGSDTLHLGSFRLPVRPGRALGYVAKLVDAGTTGTFVWAQQLPDPTGHSLPWALAAEGGRVYVAANYLPDRDRPTTTPSSPTGYYWRLTRLTDAGTAARLDWSCAAPSWAEALAVAGHQVYVAGSVHEPATFSPAKVTVEHSNPASDLLIAKVVDADSAGYLGWVQRLGSLSRQGRTHLKAVVARGPHVWVAGVFDGPRFAFGEVTLTNADTTQQTSPDVFVARLTDTGPAGCFDWAQRVGGSSLDWVDSLVLHGDKLYASGHFYYGPVWMGKQQLNIQENRNGSIWWSWLPVGEWGAPGSGQPKRR